MVDEYSSREIAARARAKSEMMQILPAKILPGEGRSNVGRQDENREGQFYPSREVV
jgi:hypothetical protein